ncbi:MAG: hypothetical protein WC369_03655 [Dehalococcoidales bacterium]|jgi:hypothetical protein
MKSSSRFIIVSGIVIGILIVVTIALVLANRSNDVTLLPEDNPNGTVQRFLVAIQEKDYPKAYGYLQLDENGRTVPYNEWVQSNYPPLSTQSVWKAAIATTTVTDNTAMVEVFVDTFRPGGPFQDPVSTRIVSFQLTKIDDAWYITTRPPIYWLY